MGQFDKFLDSPGRINSEGKNIELSFQRTSDTTARISWNIPSPSSGCNSSNQAYDGIVITVSNKPANYLTTSPKDGNYYSGDATVDPDLSTGDKLDGALVVGAFYNDKTTSFLDVTELTPKTAYYFSGYAVDNVARYYKEGVHSYSLPTGPEKANTEIDLPAIQDVGIETGDGIGPNTFTGLKQGQNYVITVLVNGKKYKLKINGTLALDYDDLVYHINQEFIRLTEDKFTSPYPPNTNAYYIDVPHQKIYQWDGYKSNIAEALFQNDDPSVPLDGTYWYNPDNAELSLYAGGWNQVPYTLATFDFSNPQCYQFWFDGTTNVYKWEKVLWCLLPTYISDVNPLLPPPLDCNSFWYNTATSLISQWDIQTASWNNINPIYSNIDPNTIGAGAYWYNQVDNNVYFYAGNVWNKLNNVTYAELDADGNFAGTLFANIYWFIPSTQKLLRRDPTNTVWIDLDIIVYVSDPTNRSTCQIWWNSTTDALNIWDTLNGAWVQVSQFYQQELDPSSVQDIPLNSAWYNPTTDVLTIINNPDCTQVAFVKSATNPMQVAVNAVWYNPDTKIWYQWDGSGWQVINVITKNSNPYLLNTGDLWFNTAANALNQWDGATWNQINYSITPFMPKENDLWFNPVNEKLYEWDGDTWIETIGIAAAKLIVRNNFDRTQCKCNIFSYFNFNDGWELPFHGDMIRFYTKKTGCAAHIELCFDDGMNFVFANIQQNVIYFLAKTGYSALDSGPMYQQIGVGTDGSPDERRRFDTIIRSTLGAGVTTVELTKEQVDICIDNALKEVRKNSNLAVKRAFFFLDVFPKQQLYLLKDKCVGSHKIVDVNSIYRTRGAMFGAGAVGQDGLFAYSALQNLYTLGTFDLLSFHLVSAYSKDLQTLFAENIMFQWVETTRALRMYQTFYGKERVLIDASIERTEQDLLTDRETTLWLQKWAIAQAKLILSQSRGKMPVMAGPNGNTSLNAQDLISQADQEMTALREELADFVMQDLVDVGMRSHLVIG